MTHRPLDSRTLACALSALLLNGMLVACGGGFVDKDSSAKTALGLPTQLTVEGELDVDKGDTTDWKQFTAQASGEATLAVRVGDPFEGRHTVTGNLAIFDRDANQLKSLAIVNTTVKYSVTWPITEGTQYLVRLTASEGKASYAADLSLSLKSTDPCDDITCEEGEVCEDGECIDPNACEPACSSGKICVKGDCVRKSTKAKRPYKDPCRGKKCPSGEVCRRGVCKPKTVRKSSSACDPPCTDGATCKKGKCRLGPLAAKIVQSVPRGETTIITLNKGTSHKIKVGQSGKISGVGSFKIIEAYEFRCKAILKAPSSKLGTKKSATIYR